MKDKMLLEQKIQRLEKKKNDEVSNVVLSVFQLNAVMHV